MRNMFGFFVVLVTSSVAMAADGGGAGGWSSDRCRPRHRPGCLRWLAWSGQGCRCRAQEAMGRNPNASLMAPFIVGLALIESLVIYGLLIAFQLVGKI